MDVSCSVAPSSNWQPSDIWAVTFEVRIYWIVFFYLKINFISFLLLYRSDLNMRIRKGTFRFQVWLQNTHPSSAK